MSSCSQCGASGDSSDSFCGACGKPFRASPSAEAVKPEKGEGKKVGRVGKLLIGSGLVVLVGLVGFLGIQNTSNPFTDIEARDVFSTTTIEVLVAPDSEVDGMHIQTSEPYLCNKPMTDGKRYLNRVAPNTFRIQCRKMPVRTRVTLVAETSGPDVSTEFIVDSVRN